MTAALCWDMTTTEQNGTAFIDNGEHIETMHRYASVNLTFVWLVNNSITANAYQIASEMFLCSSLYCMHTIPVFPKMHRYWTPYPCAPVFKFTRYLSEYWVFDLIQQTIHDTFHLPNRHWLCIGLFCLTVDNSSALWLYMSLDMDKMFSECCKDGILDAWNREVYECQRPIIIRHTLDDLQYAFILWYWHESYHTGVAYRTLHAQI